MTKIKPEAEAMARSLEAEAEQMEQETIRLRREAAAVRFAGQYALRVVGQSGSQK